jgi:hypothetical protein
MRQLFDQRKNYDSVLLSMALPKMVEKLVGPNF